MGGVREGKISLKNGNMEDKKDEYGYLNIPMQQEDEETVTSIDFVFIEGEGWKLENED